MNPVGTSFVNCFNFFPNLAKSAERIEGAMTSDLELIDILKITF